MTTSTVSAAAFANPLTTIRVGSVADSRFNNGGWTLDGGAMVYTREKLLNQSNFGPSGTYAKTIVITDVSASIDASILTNVDVFFIGKMPASFSATELTAMTNWVSTGGVMIITANDTPSDQVSNAFGLPVTATSAESYTVPYVTYNSHAIWTGPFGNLNSLGHTYGGSMSAYWPLVDVPANTTILGIDGSNNYTVLEMSYTSGKVIFLGDVALIADDGNYTIWDLNAAINTSSGTASTGNEAFLGNLFAYAHR